MLYKPLWTVRLQKRSVHYGKAGQSKPNSEVKITAERLREVVKETCARAAPRVDDDLVIEEMLSDANAQRAAIGNQGAYALLRYSDCRLTLVVLLGKQEQARLLLAFDEFTSQMPLIETDGTWHSYCELRM